jgi:hypothetical protein
MPKITFLTRFRPKISVNTEGGNFSFFVVPTKKALNGQSNVAFKALGEDGFKIETP